MGVGATVGGSAVTTDGTGMSLDGKSGGGTARDQGRLARSARGRTVGGGKTRLEDIVTIEASPDATTTTIGVEVTGVRRIDIATSEGETGNATIASRPRATTHLIAAIPTGTGTAMTLGMSGRITPDRAQWTWRTARQVLDLLPPPLQPRAE